MKARTRAKAGARPAAKPTGKAGVRSSTKPRPKTRKPAKPEAEEVPGKQKPGKATPARRPCEKEAEEHFVRGVLIRGEAVKTRRGKLPPGATHEIVEEPDEEELPKIRRRRFSLA